MWLNLIGIGCVGMRISELSEIQKQHLIWRLDSKTYVGFITACRIVRGVFGDDDLIDIFKRAGRSDRSAKIYARKVINLDYRSVKWIQFL